MLQKSHGLVMQDLNKFSKKSVPNLHGLVIFILQLVCTHVEGAQNSHDQNITHQFMFQRNV